VSHAEHFLERLDRVPRSLSDFALELYRDPERVRWIVHYAHLPEAEERVALALAADADGPYLVVTRHGDFVTALSPEMRPKNLTILSRAQVDAFSKRVLEVRARFELAKDVVPAGKPPEDVLRLLQTRAWSLSREEFSAMAAWVPILGAQFLRDVYESAAPLLTLRNTYMTARNNAARSDRRRVQAMEVLWNATHATGARYALATTDDLAFAEPWAKAWTTSYGPTYLATAERVHSVAMRGAWAAARMGKAFFPVYKGILTEPGDQFYRFDAALAMTAIGLRHARLRDDARRAVEAIVESADDASRPWMRGTAEASERAFDDPDGATAEVAAEGAKTLVALGSRLPDGSPHKFARTEDVPQELALLVAANRGHESFHTSAMLSLPWVAKRVTALELYYPEEMERALRGEWSIEEVEDVYRRHRGKPVPVTREGANVGRNDPCGCGSGRKYKKCCGR
jgi:hypothetical protein